MGEYWTNNVITAVIFIAIVSAGCQTHCHQHHHHHLPTDRGQQYKDGKLRQPLTPVNKPNVSGQPLNAIDYARQVLEIKSASDTFYKRNQGNFTAIENWIDATGGNVNQLKNYGIDAYQMQGTDNYGNVQFTSYFTPIIEARYSAQGEFRYPIYRMPLVDKNQPLPDRAAIYNGALSSDLAIAWTKSLFDNFVMQVQGSGYVDFADNSSPIFFAYAGKNGHPYRSIGQVLIERGELPKDNASLQAVRNWTNAHSESEVRELLEQNPSFVFFKPQKFSKVKGSYGIPLLAKTAIATDRSLISGGATLLAEVPLLNGEGKFTGEYELRLMVALDVGSAIKGHHFDIYQGIGTKAESIAGFYNHFGRVWMLNYFQ